MKKRFTPDAGKYSKIDVYATTLEGQRVYMHSTNAYDTLRHAEIGCAIMLDKVAEPYYGWRYYAIIYDRGEHINAQIDPYSIKAFFSKER